MPVPGILPSRRWRWLRFEGRRPAGFPRILVIGEHQAAAIAQAIRCLAPDTAVTVMSTGALARRYPAADRLPSVFGRHDAVFLSAGLPELRNGGAVADLRRHAHVTLVPTIAFSAFHPDLVRIDADAGARVQGPMGASHSALVLFGFLSGLSQEEVAGLFQHRVFERVGYFDVWDASVKHLRMLGAEAGFDLEPHLARWVRRGCFMHTVDHVKLHVAADLARSLLDRAGIHHDPCNLEDHLSDDPGEAGCWPVYPDIAAHYGVPGSSLFLRPGWRRHPRTSPTMSLKMFIDASFAVYVRLPRQALMCRRVTLWQADTDLAAALLDAAIQSRSAARPVP